MNRTDQAQPPVAASTKLTDQERAELAQLVRTAGWRTLLRLMEMHCRLQDAKLLGAPVFSPEAQGEHAVAVAMWGFFAAVQNQVEHEVNEFCGAHNAAPEEPLDETRALL